MLRSRVAENSNRWPAAGVWSSSEVTCGMKPMSAIWSASSSTVTATRSSRQAPRSMRSLSRPGVATTTSAPARSALAWRSADMPPTTVASRSRRARA